ncbi:MAG: polysaccharide biosynthesis tyrosine autokinase [Pseudomonadota bacterium]
MNPSPRITPKLGAAQSHGTALDLDHLVKVLWQGKWRIGFWVFVCCVAALVYVTRIATPLYTATTDLALDTQDENIVSFENVVSGISSDYYTIQTELETLRSRNLMRDLVEALRLDEDPEFNFWLLPASPGLVDQGLGFVLGIVAPPVRMLTGIEVPTGAEEEDTPPPTERQIRDDTINAVLEKISVASVRDSRVFRIAVRTEDPEKSARIADRLAELYILNQLEVKFDATEQATTWLSARVADLKAELETAENDVKTFTTDMDLVSVQSLEALNRQLKDFRDKTGDLGLRQETLGAQVRNLESAAAEGDRTAMAAIADDLRLDQILPRLATGGDAIATAFDVRFGQVLDRARLEQTRNADQIGALRRSIVEIETQVETQSADLVKLEELQREAEASRLIYEYFLSRLKETSVQAGIQQADSHVLSPAVIPRDASSPRKAVLMLTALIIGLLIGVALTLFRELGRSNFRQADELEQTTGVGVVGTIPNTPSRTRNRVLQFMASKPNSAMAEAVRNLRTSIMLSNVDSPPQIIMVASSIPGEGKTTLSLALAHSFAGVGKRVLVIEGDIRRRTLRKYFTKDRRENLLALVQEKMPLEEAVMHDEQLGIDLLLSEPSSVNAADFFTSERLVSMLARARERYDIILIDTPPVLIVPDARIVGQLVDAVIYVVRWDATLRNMVQQGLEAFASVGVKINGMVLNQVDIRKATHYSGNYQKYGHKYYAR